MNRQTPVRILPSFAGAVKCIRVNMLFLDTNNYNILVFVDTV